MPYRYEILRGGRLCCFTRSLFTALQVALVPQADMQAVAECLYVGCRGVPSSLQPLHGPPAQPLGPSASPSQSRRRSATTSWHQHPTHAPLQGSGFPSEHSIERATLLSEDVGQHEIVTRLQQVRSQTRDMATKQRESWQQTGYKA